MIPSVRIPLALAAIAALAGCAYVTVDPSPRPAPVETAPEQDSPFGPVPLPEEMAPRVLPLEITPEEQLADAEELLRAARSAPPGERESLELAAAGALIGAGRSEHARALLDRMEPSTLTPPLAAEYWLLQGRLALQAGQPERAVDFATRATRQGGVGPERVAEAWLLKANAHRAAGEPIASAEALIARERYITHYEDLLSNHLEIRALLRNLDPERLRSLRASGRESVLVGWMDLVLAEQRGGADAYRRDAELADWARRHPEHPGVQLLSATPAGTPTSEARLIDSIALLLPLSSDFGAAARAVHDGFLAMHEANTSPRKPRVRVYDTGAESFLLGDYYRTAVADGADLVIGPLGRDAVDALVTGTDLTSPTLLLGETTSPVFSEAPVYQFGLLPEHDARAVARRAWADGHRVAVLLHPADDWGQRIVTAFRQEWDARGGTVARIHSFHAGQTDYALPIRRLLSVDTSEARRDRVANVIGQRPNFDTRRRQDIDFVFLAARSREGRLIRPQISFFQGHDLPVYATSHIFDVRPDPLNDTDLNGVIFPDMPWILARDGHVAAMRGQIAGGEAPYRNSPLDRLYAFGADVYALAPHMEQLRANPYVQYDGLSSRIRVTRGGIVERELVWARFEDGTPVPLAPAQVGDRQPLHHRESERHGTYASHGAAPATRTPGGTGG